MESEISWRYLGSLMNSSSSGQARGSSNCASISATRSWSFGRKRRVAVTMSGIESVSFNNASPIADDLTIATLSESRPRRNMGMARPSFSRADSRHPPPAQQQSPTYVGLHPVGSAPVGEGQRQAAADFVSSGSKKYGGGASDATDS
jgi:hypothetical protein